jgi:ZIP family zinc transporter
MLLSVLAYILTPVVALAVGAVIAAFRPISPRLRSYTQHLAAGVVFAALGTEILPRMMAGKPQIRDVVLGFSVGVVLMLVIRYFAEKMGGETDDESEDQGSFSLLAAVSVDVLIDGLLLGIGLGIGQSVGLLLTIALTLEILFLGLATAATFRKTGTPRGRVIAAATAPALPFAGGAIAGVLLLGGLHGGWLERVLSFAAAALLYLVTEELLTEAHEVPETPLSTAMFFVGFLALFLIKLLT